MKLRTPLPNVRKLFLTDPGYVQFEADLKGADAQVVAWEAEDEMLMQLFRSGLDVHAQNAEDMFSSKFSQADKPRKKFLRKQCKLGVHLTNYGGTPPTLAQSLNWTRREAEDFQRRWFDLHPGVRDIFHRKVRESLERNRTVTNRFGFRIVYFDRIDNVFTEALAWIPQSTVALVTYYAGLQLEQRFWPHHQALNYVPPPGDFAGLLLQTHDSLNFQFLLQTLPPLRDIVRSLAVPIPYASPLTIPWELKQSTVSWGAMEPVSENEYA